MAIEENKYYKGRTFYALYQTAGEKGLSYHERLEFNAEGYDSERAFFEWLQDQREEIEKSMKTSAFIANANIL